MLPARPVTLALIVVALLAGVASSAPPRSELLRVHWQVERELRERPEMREATAEVARLRAEYAAARSAVRAELWSEGEFLRLVAEADELQGRIDAIHHRHRYGRSPAGPVGELAARVFELRSLARAMLAEALANDPDVEAAREAFQRAGRRLTDLNRRIPDQIRMDARFRAARERL